MRAKNILIGALAGAFCLALAAPALASSIGGPPGGGKTPGSSVVSPDGAKLEIAQSLQSAVTGASKSWAAADCNKHQQRSNSGTAMTDSLPASGCTEITIENGDASATDTISVTGGGTIKGSTTFGLLPGRRATFDSDGAGNYGIWISNNSELRLTQIEQSAPSTPSSGSSAVWADSTDHNLETKDSSGNSHVMVRPTSSTASQYLTAIAANGAVTKAQPAASDISGLAASATTDTTNAANIASGTLPAARLPLPTTSTLGALESITCASHQWINKVPTTQVQPTCAQPAASDVSGLAASATTDTTNAANIGSGVLPAARLPLPTTTALGALESITCPSHQFINLIPTTQVQPTCVQPAASDISGLAASATTDTTNAANIGSGVLPAARLPMPTTTALGALESIACPSHQWIDVIPTTQVQPTCAQPAAADVSGLAASATTDTTNAANIGSGILPSARLPLPTTSVLGGLESIACPSHQWIDLIPTTQVQPTCAQPAAADVSGLAASATTDTTNAANIGSGTLPAARLPLPTTTTLGSLESIACPSHQWVDVIPTTQVQPTCAQPAASDISGLAASATTDTTNASNVSSGNLPAARNTTVAPGDVLGNSGGSSAAASDNTMDAILDKNYGTTQGGVPYRGASNWGALAPGTNTQALCTAGASANPYWCSMRSFFSGLAATSHTQAGGVTDYYTCSGLLQVAPNGSEVNATCLAPLGGTFRNLYILSNVAAPGAGNTFTITLRVNNADTAVTCTISNTNTTCNDTSHTVTITAGQTFDIKIASSASAATSAFAWGFELDTP